jgi:hypothetical protein
MGMHNKQEKVMAEGPSYMPIALIFIHSIIMRVCRHGRYMAKRDVCFILICLHERILEMFVCSCKIIRKAVE